jgi:alpha-L-fucosidase
MPSNFEYAIAISIPERRTFLSHSAALLASPHLFAASEPAYFGQHYLPKTDSHYKVVQSYVEETPIPPYHWASGQAYEAFLDQKYGIRIHWGLYSQAGFLRESWPYLKLSYAKRDSYNQMYKTWNPNGFDADQWTTLFQESGLKMFAFTTKHHEGFSMFDTKTRVRKRVRWNAPGEPVLEDCDLAYSIMETPFRRDVVKELCAAGHKRGLRIALYFSHPDWYDADFRPYADHPVQIPSAALYDTKAAQSKEALGKLTWIAPDPSKTEVDRMLLRHRAQIEELLTNYGQIDMLSLDQWLGPRVWPQLRETLRRVRQLQPNIMIRARGIGNYGDYYTPEGFVPGSKSNTGMPWMVIYPLARSFSFDPDASQYKGAQWIIKNIVDTSAKGGSFQVGVGPDGTGRFHPAAIQQLKEAGKWLKVCGSGIYATRARSGDLWREEDNIRFTRTKDERGVHCFAFEWPGKTLTLKTVRPQPQSKITMFGYNEPLRWRYETGSGLSIDLPEAMASEDKRPTHHCWGWTIRIA